MPRVRLYRFFNYQRDRHGEPFALCDPCYLSQIVPDGCILNKIADQAVAPCAKCGAERKNAGEPQGNPPA